MNPTDQILVGDLHRYRANWKSEARDPGTLRRMDFKGAKP